MYHSNWCASLWMPFFIVIHYIKMPFHLFKKWQAKTSIEQYNIIMMKTFGLLQSCDVSAKALESIIKFNLKKVNLSKSTWGEQPVEDILKFTRIFLYVCHVYWPNEKRYRPEIWHTYSHWPYLKVGFLFFDQITGTAASLQKLPCHVDFPHNISSIAL